MGRNSPNRNMGGASSPSRNRCRVWPVATEYLRISRRLTSALIGGSWRPMADLSSAVSKLMSDSLFIQAETGPGFLIQLSKIDLALGGYRPGTFPFEEFLRYFVDGHKALTG